MSYRKLEVEGEEYEYVIGRSYVKVKGVGAWPKEEVGEMTIRYYGDGFIYDDEDVVYSKSELDALAKSKGYIPQAEMRVRPGNVADKIRQAFAEGTK
jgi:hypothetical protein